MCPTLNCSWFITFFIGLTLDKNKTSDIWDPDVKGDANDSAQGYRGEHTLLVKQVNINVISFRWVYELKLKVAVQYVLFC